MQLTEGTATVRRVLKVELAKVWHYRRQGVYYLRIRPRGLSDSCTISLRTRDRAQAMANSRQIQITLRSFHLDNPEAEWPELRARLIEIAEEMLDTPTEWERLDGMGMVYSDAWEGLIAVAKTQRLTVPQAKAVTVAREIMEAAQRRLGGDPQGLVDIYERLTAETEPLVHQQVAQKGPEKPPVLMADITKAFLSEYEKDAKSGTLKNIKTACESFVAFLGDLDMRTHTRDDMNRLKDHMMETLKPSTVNVRLTHLNAILELSLIHI